VLTGFNNCYQNAKSDLSQDEDFERLSETEQEENIILKIQETLQSLI
jgi:hypothetical protein